MKKRFLTILTALMLAFAFVLPAFAAEQDMWAYVYKWEGGINADGTLALTRIESGITFKVLAIDSDTAETLTYYKGSTSLTNPVTTTSFNSATICNDMVAFRVDPTDSTNDRYVDLIVVDTNGGYTKFIENFDKYQHTIVIDERPNTLQQGTIWFSCTTAYPKTFAAETTTGVSFLADTFIQDVRVEIVTTTSGTTMAVGLLDVDQDGLRFNVLQTTAGYIADTGVITSGVCLDYTAASNYGDLLYTKITGANSLWNSTNSLGGRSYKGHVVTSSNSGTITYSCSSTAGATTADPNPAGYIHYWFNRIR
ncbi:MAG: hypothetical protein WC637_00315 [Victivallales bacterium]|jgi:hypothetical protein